MGYVPVLPPNAIITLPENTSPAAAELIRRDLTPTLTALYSTYSVMATPADFGQQTTRGPGKLRRPTSGYEKYRYDLYGPAKRDWFYLLNAGLLASGIALLLVIAVILLGIA